MTDASPRERFGDGSLPPLTQTIAAGCASMSLTDDPDVDRAIEILRAARDAGIGLFDTARAYATAEDPTHNEALLRRAFGAREGITVMTKGGHFRTGPHTWDVDNSPARLRRDVEDSLRALNAEQVDLFFVHRADGPISIADSFGELAELRAEGKIAALGISNATSDQIRQAHAIAGIAAVQNRLELGVDSVETVRMAENLNIAFFAYSPLGGPGAAAGVSLRFPHLAGVARQRGVSVQRLVLRALLSQSSSASAVVGIGRRETARDCAAVPSEPWDRLAQQALERDLSGASTETIG